MKYLDISPDCHPIEITYDPKDSSIDCLPFHATLTREAEYKIKFNYNVPTKLVTLSLLQIMDLVNLYKIYVDQNPGWKDPNSRLINIGNDLKA